MVRHFLVFTNIWLDDVAKIPKVPRPQGNNMDSRRKHVILYHFKLGQFTSTSPVFTQQNTLKNKLPWKVLIEQIIEFKLRGPGLPGRTCTPTTIYFHDKTKISKKSFRVDHYLLLKYCRRQCTLLPPTWAKSLTTFNPKIKDCKVFWT